MCLLASLHVHVNRFTSFFAKIDFIPDTCSLLATAVSKDPLL